MSNDYSALIYALTGQVIPGLGGGSTTAIEEKRTGRLIKDGVLGYDQLGNPEHKGPAENPEWDSSRDESKLTPEDIWGYAAWGEKFGNKWMGGTEEARRKIAAEALRRGLVREHRGTVDIAWDPELEKFAEETWGTPAAAPQGDSGGGDGGQRRRRPARSGGVALGDLAPKPIMPDAPQGYDQEVATPVTDYAEMIRRMAERRNGNGQR